MSLPLPCLPFSALETFKLLLELSYSVTYTRRPSDSPTTTFDPNTLVQLISEAGMEGWDVDMALSIINALTPYACQGA